VIVKNQQQFISDVRLQNYKDMNEYKQNIYLSEKYYILLSIFEVSLRNSINYYFTIKISNEWLYSDLLHTDTKQKVKEAKNKILQRKELITHDKILAELSFGFWTSLFRKSYSNMIRKRDIKFIFPNIPSKNTKLINRNILDKRLNHIRIFHYERIINKIEYENVQDEIYDLLLYFDVEIYNFAKEIANKNGTKVINYG